MVQVQQKEQSLGKFNEDEKEKEPKKKKNRQKKNFTEQREKDAANVYP